MARNSLRIQTAPDRRRRARLTGFVVGTLLCCSSFPAANCDERPSFEKQRALAERTDRLLVVVSGDQTAKTRKLMGVGALDETRWVLVEEASTAHSFPRPVRAPISPGVVFVCTPSGQMLHFWSFPASSAYANSKLAWSHQVWTKARPLPPDKQRTLLRRAHLRELSEPARNSISDRFDSRWTTGPAQGRLAATDIRSLCLAVAEARLDNLAERYRGDKPELVWLRIRSSLWLHAETGLDCGHLALAEEPFARLDDWKPQVVRWLAGRSGRRASPDAAAAAQLIKNREAKTPTLVIVTKPLQPAPNQFFTPLQTPQHPLIRPHLVGVDQRRWTGSDLDHALGATKQPPLTGQAKSQLRMAVLNRRGEIIALFLAKPSQSQLLTALRKAKSE
ncbi:MAG: hypothetical protein QGG36_08630 [Pirellulaceae bacterium]|jgi:hypothetical protein|nr:hypothetical protein [Pirellulaceae bacterium]MDP7015851.1 hypothetical protein [Pirellulaceae bacterium]